MHITGRIHRGDEGEECKQVEAMEGMKRELGDLNKAVFRGNGKPSLMARMDVQESKMQLLIWMGGATFAAVVGQIAVMVFGK